MHPNMKVIKSAEEYAVFRRTKRLEQGTWRDEYENGKTVACALGAFLGAHHDGEAQRIGCATAMMPQWLVEATPSMFDHSYSTENYHLKWADKLYMPNGLIERANRLPKRQREALYKKAEKEIIARYQCAVPKAQREKFKEYWSHTVDEAFAYFTDEGLKAEKAAGTVIHVLDELLTAAGV